MALIPEENKGLEEIQGTLPARDPAELPGIYPIGTLFAERFEIKDHLGRGTLGSVYCAMDQVENRLIVLKVLRRDLLQNNSLRRRFDRFLKLVESLEPPNSANFVKVFFHDRWQNEDYIVREYVDGKALDQLIIDRKKNQQLFKLEEIINILDEVSKGLKGVEEKTFHGSLTPSNILITPDCVKVSELALARIFSPAQFSSLQIYYGSGYFYLAPEYDKSGTKIDQRADLYAAAVIAYEMLTGDIPKQPLIPPSEINSNLSPSIDGPFLKALHLDPIDRQKNLTEFMEQLSSLSGWKAEKKQKNFSRIFSIEKSEKLNVINPEKKSLGRIRLSQAIQSQLDAYKENHHYMGPEKTPVLPSPPVPVVKPSWNPMVLGPDSDQQSLFSGMKKYGSWVLLFFGFMFALYMWSDFQAPYVALKDTDLSQTKDPQLSDLRADPQQGIKVRKDNLDLPSSKSPPPLIKRGPLMEQDLGEANPKNAQRLQKKLFSSSKAPSQKPPGNKNETAKNSKKGSIKASTGLAVASAMKHSKCSKGMVYIPSATFTYGLNDPDRDFLEFSARNRRVTGFCIDRYEWPNRKGEWARSRVSFTEAAALCAEQSKRLCTEIEWERACKGPEQSLYPYGWNYRANQCNTKNTFGNPRKVDTSGQYATCTNAWKVFDMSGNISEWTAGRLNDQKSDRMIRGGSFKSSDWGSRCTYRKNRLPNYRDDSLGFRCCQNSLY